MTARPSQAFPLVQQASQPRSAMSGLCSLQSSCAAILLDMPCQMPPVRTPHPATCPSSSLRPGRSGGAGAPVAKPLADPHDREAALASCLLLSASEAILGLRTGWSEHLAGARSVIMSAGAATGAGQEELRGPAAFWGSAEGEYLEGLGGAVDSYLGVHSQVLVYISQISALDAPGDIAPDDPQSNGEETVGRAAACSQIEQQLRSWQPSPADPILEATANAYKSAALIYLYQRMREKSLMTAPLEPMGCGEVQSVLDSVARIPEDAHPDGVLLFPLFMAGGETTSLRDMETIRSRLRSIDKIRGFRNVLRACEVLEEVWQARAAATVHDSVNWGDVLRSQGGGLLLT